MAKSGITLRKAIEHAIATEQRGAEHYGALARALVAHKSVAAVFSQLAADEKDHEAEFSRLLKEVPVAEPTGGAEPLQLLQAAAVAGELDVERLANAAEITTPREALLRALAFERSTLFYYQSLRDVLGASPQIEAMIAAEKQHVTTLMKVLVSDAEFRGLGDLW